MLPVQSMISLFQLQDDPIINPGIYKCVVNIGSYSSRSSIVHDLSIFMRQTRHICFLNHHKAWDELLPFSHLLQNLPYSTGSLACQHRFCGTYGNNGFEDFVRISESSKISPRKFLRGLCMIFMIDHCKQI